MSGLVEQVTVLLTPLVKNFGCALYGCEYLAQSGGSVLRIYIEREDGTSVRVEDCEKISRSAGTLFDVENIIPGHYYLEVSSPGMDRRLFTLQHCERYVGREVRVQLHQALENRKKFVGQLQAVKEENITLLVEGKMWEIPFTQVKRANLTLNQSGGVERGER